MGRQDREGVDDQPMLGSVFYAPDAQRRPRDSAWKFVYIASLLLSIIGGIYALQHRNKDFARLISADYLSDPSHCPAAAGPSRRLLGDGDDVKPKQCLEAAGVCTGVSITGGLLLGLLSLYLVKSKPHAMVGAAVALQVLLPAAAGVAVLAAGGGGGAVPLFLVAGLIGFVFYLYRQQLALVGRLLSVSSHALVENPSIVWGSLLLQAGGLLLVVPLMAGVLLAYSNGGVVANPSAVSYDQQAKMCVGDQGQSAMCCTWMPEGWAIAYMSWGMMVVGWTSLLVFTIKVFVISGVTAQWYFAPAMQKPRGALGRSLRHAFGPSFGSLCLASWLLNLLQMLKSMAENARSENRDNFLVQLLLSCFEFLLTLLEAVTKFAVVRLAITGEALMDSCKSTADLLARNLLDSVGVWWFPGMILQVTALLLAAVWGFAVFGASYSYWGGNKAALSSGVAMGALAFFFGLLTISFINSILLNIVDAVYICGSVGPHFAMDRDARTCTRLEVHEVYSLLPSNKAPMGVVEQPDGDYAFGTAAGPAAPHPYPQTAPQSSQGWMGHPGGYAQPGTGYPSVPRV